MENRWGNWQTSFWWALKSQLMVTAAMKLKDALWCWRRLLKVPWTARRSNHSILKEISPGCKLEGLMLKLKFQYFGHLMWKLTHLKRPWCWERVKAGGERVHRVWDGWMTSPAQWTWVWINPGSWWWTGRRVMLQYMGPQSIGHNWATELNWTESGWRWWSVLQMSAHFAIRGWG